MTPAYSSDTLHANRDGTTATATDRAGLEYDDARRILDLLADNDGSLPQSSIVSELDVSKATVSRRLAELEDAGYISRLLFRGQKLVWMADQTPPALNPGAETTAD